MSQAMKIPRILIAGTHSGVGKTTVTLGLIDGFRARGLAVQPYKVGPDYIDPSLHTALAGRASRNLDSFLCEEPALRDIFAHGAQGADLCVIEGVMGVFDGYSGVDERGSSAHAARLLGCPVILVVDAWAMARSAAALVLGFQQYDPRLHWAGVFLNRVANATHLHWLSQSIEKATGLPVVGHLFKEQALVLSERHLGLLPRAEKKLPDVWRAALRRQLSKQVRWDEILQWARQGPALRPPARSLFARSERPPVRIGVARDQAFSFYYPDNLDLFESRGAELVSFRPTEDRQLPRGLQGLYFGGGFPEVYAEALGQNEPLKEDIRNAAQAGLPIYGECGGLMYLGKSITDFEGRRWRMAGVFPWETVMERTLKLAYVHGRALRPSPLFRSGETFRAHVFHFSRLVGRRGVQPTTQLSNESAPRRKGANETDGWRLGNTIAAYAHLHFASQPAVVDRWLKTAEAFRWRGWGVEPRVVSGVEP